MAVSVIESDPIVWPVLNQLVASLTSWFAVQPDPPTRIGIRWGTDYTPQFAENAGDEACQGIVWVRFVQVGDSSVNFPGAGGLARPSPHPNQYGVTVEIGVARCARQWNVDAAGLPDQLTWNALTLQCLNDMAVIRKAVECSVVAPGGDSRGISWGIQAPLPVEGNATGSTIQLTIPVVGSKDCTEC